MKKTKNLLRSMLVLLCIVLGVSGCKYDDSNLWSEIDTIKSQFVQLNESVGSLKKVVEALEKKKTVNSVVKNTTGYTITFNDGQIVEIANGKNGADAPVIGVKESEGVYYWTLTTGTTTDFIYDHSTPKKRLPVSGKDGVSPVLAVDAEGYWTLSGTRLTDASGKPVKAVGKDGDSFFKSVLDGDSEVTFTLTDGTTIVLPKTNKNLSFILPEGESQVGFLFGQTRSVTLNLNHMKHVELLKAPENWQVKIDLTAKTVTITAQGESYAEGAVSLIGIDKNGSTLLASLPVYGFDYTDPQGTFVLCEGNMTTVNGTLTYYDRNGKEYKKVFENANNNKEIGNVCQDLAIQGGRLYLLTQNGDNMQGAGRFVVCDAKTLKMIYADPLVIKTPDNKGTWPQHLVVTDSKTAYVQYSESGMEATSGICKLTLTDNSVTVGETVTGTYGAFTVAGATKTRMVYSRGKIYAGVGQKVVIINPSTASVEKSIPFEGRQVKGIVKAADNNLYVTLSGTFTGSGYTAKLTSDPRIVALNHAGDEVSQQDLAGIKLPIATWSPAVGMCASFTHPYIYFVDSDDFSATTVSRYNYQTKTLEKHYVSGSQTIYGIMGEHPTTHQLWVGKSSYTDSEIYVYDVSGASAVKVRSFNYPTQNEASPAGVDFAYRFTSEYISR